LALELNPTKEIAETGINICDAFVTSIKLAAAKDATDASAKIFIEKDWKEALVSAATAESKEQIANNLAQRLKATKSKYRQALNANPQYVAQQEAKYEQLGINAEIVEKMMSIDAELTEMLFAGKFIEAEKAIDERFLFSGSGKESYGKYNLFKIVEAKLKAASPGKSPPKSGRFVATACYGDYEHPIVMELRQFRDDVLESTIGGRVFVRWYYRCSPPFANFISPLLKTLARVLIVAPAIAIARSFAKNKHI
jgi:hypothetical protein